MKSFNCTPQSWPLLPDTTTHHLWQAWDMTLEAFINNNVAVQKGTIMADPRNNLSASMSSNLAFFTDQLTAFDLWLEFSLASSEPPEQLPVVLQALLSQTHRLRALQLLKKYLALGPSAVNLSLMVGIYPYILKLLQSPAEDIKHTLIAIWASIMGFDPTCRNELTREKAQLYFIQFLQAKALPAEQRCMAAFVLAEICNQHKEGQQSCLHLGLHRVCTTTILQPEVLTSSNLKKWICLCLYKQCEDCSWAKYLCITEAGHTHLYPLLVDADPTVRTAAVLALGEIFGASALSASLAAGAGNSSAPGTPSRGGGMTPVEDRSRAQSFNGSMQERDLREAELQLVWQILDCCTDGSITVRLEAIYALSKCLILPAHIDCIKMVARAVRKRNVEKKTQKIDKRTASPSQEAGSFSKINFSHPWHLTPAETTEIMNQVEQFIAAQMQHASALQMHLMSQSASVYDRFSPTMEVGNAAATGNAQSGFNAGPLWLQAQQQAQLQTQQAQQGMAFPAPRSAHHPDTAWLSAGAATQGPIAGASSASVAEGAGAEKGRTFSEDQHQQQQQQTQPHAQPKSPKGTTDSHPPTPSLHSLMASVYVRVWLALTEVQGKDPNSIVVNAAAMIRFKIFAIIAAEDKFTPLIEISCDSADSVSAAGGIAAAGGGIGVGAGSSFGGPSSSSAKGRGGAPPFMQWAGSPFGSPSTRGNKHIASSASGEDNSSSSFVGDVSLTLPSGAGSGKRTPGKGAGGAAGTPPPPVFPMGIAGNSNNVGSLSTDNFIAPPLSGGKSSSKLGYRSQHAASSQSIPESGEGPMLPSSYSFTEPLAGGPPMTPSFGDHRSGSFGLRRGTSNGSINDAAAADVFDEEGALSCISRTYDEAKKKFLRPDPGFVAMDDPLSLAGANKAYRSAKILGIMGQQKRVASLFKDIVLEDRPGDGSSGGPSSSAAVGKAGKGGVDDAQQSRGAAVSNLSPNVTKFEEKVLLTINNAVMTSLVMFHAFQDILAVSDESSVSIWSLGSSSRIMEIKNKHSVVRSEKKDMIKRINTVEASIFTPLAEPRITAMQWINESYNSLLMLGSDDGVVKVWRDTSTSDAGVDQLAALGGGGGNTRGSVGGSMSVNVKDANNGRGLAPSTVELATAFSALPDIAETSRGSGLLLSWQQSTGTLLAGGNSSSIRVWDLGREQCVRVFDTGSKTCLTALATTVGAFAPSPLTSPHAHQQHHSGEISAMNNFEMPLSWTFAGFADGSIGVYDERVHSNGGRVHQARDHSSWIVSCHMRPDTQEVVTSSVRGSVKFWDIRSWRTYKTLDVQKSPLTSMTVHNCAPIIATGSHAQFIKILTFGGEQLGNIIKYHDGFLGQRMGPITSLTFHPHRMMLAASAADCIVSIYSTADDSHSHS